MDKQYSYDVRLMTPVSLTVPEWEKVIEALKYKIVDPAAMELAAFLTFLLWSKRELTVKKMTMRITRRQAQLVRRAKDL